MLRIIASTAATAAKRYFTQSLSRGDYYAGETGEPPGRWGGRGAERLGLPPDGEVDRASFAALCENEHPQTDDKLTLRQNTNRRVGYDFNFHAPKSVSVMHALTGDERIMASFRAAVRETMGDIEREAKTRVRSDCLKCQVFILAALHSFWSRSMALRMTSSLRIEATRATIFFLPAATRRW